MSAEVRLSDDDLRTMESEKLLEHVERLEAMQRLRALESFLGFDSFGGTDVYFRMLRDRYGEPGQWMVPNVSSDRKSGENRPLILNETQLNLLREQSRILLATNPYAQGLHENQINYIVGKGFTYKVKGRNANGPDGLPQKPDEPTQQRITAVQKWCDAWIARNRWSASARDPRTMQAVAQPRERECVARTLRDGEAMVRLHLFEDGDSAARFVEPVQVRNNGVSVADGWTWGMKHRTEPFVDVETIVAYWISYWTEEETEDHDEVPADEIIHFKLQRDDAAIKRGVPLYSFGVYSALERAYKLQETASKTAAFRAGNAEYWQHETGTASNIGAFGKTVPNQIGGGSHVEERMGPGPRIRRMGPGTTPINPTAAGFTEYGQVAQGDLRQAGASVAAPEFVVSGDASNNNYASIKESGTPFVLATAVSQEHFVTGCLAVIYRAMRHAIDKGVLPSDTLDMVELHAETAKDDSREPLERAQEDQILVSVGIKSVQTAQRERGLDPEQQATERQEWAQQFGNQGMALDPNADPYQEPATTDAPPPDSANPATEPAQNLALNGAQMASLQAIAQAVADGLLPAATAVKLIMVSIPTLSEADVKAIILPADGFTPAQPPQPTPGMESRETDSLDIIDLLEAIDEDEVAELLEDIRPEDRAYYNAIISDRTTLPEDTDWLADIVRSAKRNRLDVDDAVHTVVTKMLERPRGDLKSVDAWRQTLDASIGELRKETHGPELTGRKGQEFDHMAHIAENPRAERRGDVLPDSDADKVLRRLQRAPDSNAKQISDALSGRHGVFARSRVHDAVDKIHETMSKRPEAASETLRSAISRLKAERPEPAAAKPTEPGDWKKSLASTIEKVPDIDRTRLANMYRRHGLAGDEFQRMIGELHAEGKASPHLLPQKAAGTPRPKPKKPIEQRVLDHFAARPDTDYTTMSRKFAKKGVYSEDLKAALHKMHGEGKIPKTFAFPRPAAQIGVESQEEVPHIGDVLLESPPGILANYGLGLTNLHAKAMKGAGKGGAEKIPIGDLEFPGGLSDEVSPLQDNSRKPIIAAKTER